MQDWEPSSRCRSEHSATGDAVSRKRGLAGPNGSQGALSSVLPPEVSQVTVPRVVRAVPDERVPSGAGERAAPLGLLGLTRDRRVNKPVRKSTPEARWDLLLEKHGLASLGPRSGGEPGSR